MDLYIVHIYDKREVMLWIICLTICRRKDCGELHCLAQCTQGWGVWSALEHSVWSLHFASLECNGTHIHLRLHKYVHIHTYTHTYIRTYVYIWQSGAWDYYVHVSCEPVTILSYTEHLHFILTGSHSQLPHLLPPTLVDRIYLCTC